MSILKEPRFGGHRFPVMVVIGLSVVALAATPRLESHLTGGADTSLLAETLDPGSVEFVSADTRRLQHVTPERLKPVH